MCTNVKADRMLRRYHTARHNIKGVHLANHRGWFLSVLQILENRIRVRHRKVMSCPIGRRRCRRGLGANRVLLCRSTIVHLRCWRSCSNIPLQNAKEAFVSEFNTKFESKPARSTAQKLTPHCGLSIPSGVLSVLTGIDARFFTSEFGMKGAPGLFPRLDLTERVRDMLDLVGSAFGCEGSFRTLCWLPITNPRRTTIYEIRLESKCQRTTQSRFASYKTGTVSLSCRMMMHFSKKCGSGRFRVSTEGGVNHWDRNQMTRSFLAA